MFIQQGQLLPVLILVFALPLADTAFAFIRRIITGNSPFKADRGHLHHKLIDRGYEQKYAVMILYAVSGMLGISAIMFSFGWTIRSLIIIIFTIFILYGNLNSSFKKEITAENNNTDNSDIATKQ